MKQTDSQKLGRPRNWMHFLVDFCHYFLNEDSWPKISDGTGMTWQEWRLETKSLGPKSQEVGTPMGLAKATAKEERNVISSQGNLLNLFLWYMTCWLPSFFWVYHKQQFPTSKTSSIKYLSSIIKLNLPKLPTFLTHVHVSHPRGTSAASGCSGSCCCRSCARTRRARRISPLTWERPEKSNPWSCEKDKNDPNPSSPGSTDVMKILKSLFWRPRVVVVL